MNNSRILLVEDESGIRRICRRVLIAEGYQVDVAAHGAIAEEMLMEEDYDLILVDIKTPVMNGKQLYQYIRERHPGLIDRVVFTTGDVIGNDTQSFLEQAGRPVLLKPFTPGDLKATVKKTLAGHTNL